MPPIGPPYRPMSHGRVTSIVPSCERLCPFAKRYVMTSFAKKKLLSIPSGSRSRSRITCSYICPVTFSRTSPASPSDALL